MESYNKLEKNINKSVGDFAEVLISLLREFLNAKIDKALFFKENTMMANGSIIQKIYANDKDILVYDSVKQKSINIRSMDIDEIAEIIDFIRFKPQTRYGWVNYQNGCKLPDYVIERCSNSFQTKEEAYNDMRIHALKKMQWDTNYPDFEDEYAIVYKVEFHKDKIVLNSHSSGVMLYMITEL